MRTPTSDFLDVIRQLYKDMEIPKFTRYEPQKKEVIRDVEIEIVDELEPRTLIYPTDESIKLLGKIEVSE